ncbi:hypothetical protein [Chryseobacterium sp. AG844]|uniref:hypothetical protein n=1 Tax=Chryseobacterium sp. AG844 TaxID=2183998 RepID=UPI000D70BAC2|nr:hypothetical protein [Chryseobacterium sp. AG844]PWW30641.1 hypothetical protein DEU40_10156 [Chryseobacterium sp. AG844]
MTDKSRNVLIILIVIAVAILYKFIFPFNKEDGFLDEMKQKDIKSKVYKKTIDFENHGIPYIVYGKKDSIIIYRDWEDKIEIGDSILKPKGSLELIIKNSNKFELFSYDNQDLKLPSP